MRCVIGKEVFMAIKIFNTFKYGDKRTKRTLGMIIAFLLTSVLLSVVALATMEFAIFFASIPIMASGVVLLSRNRFVEKRDVTEKHDSFVPSKADELYKQAYKENKAKKTMIDVIEENDDMPLGRDNTLLNKKRYSNPLERYSEDEIKKLFVEYKVKKEHVMVLIDRNDKNTIRECPAFVWKDKVFMYFLILGLKPEMVKYDLRDATTMQIKRNVKVVVSEEYLDFKGSTLIGKMFEYLLPKYSAKEDSFKPEFTKNLYSPVPGMWCTAASAVELNKINNFSYEICDSLINSSEYSDYFREVYVSRQMFRDGVIDANEYKDKVLSVLEGLALAHLADDIYGSFLNQMVQKGLIPFEYAEFTNAKRRKALR